MSVVEDVLSGGMVPVAVEEDVSMIDGSGGKKSKARSEEY